jgi:RimJ/RimL family protein N-acetyltransferase
VEEQYCLKFQENFIFKGEKIMKNSFKSKRLLMRNYLESDIDDYWDYISSEDVGPRLNFPPYKTKEDAFARLTIETQKPTQFAIVLKSDNKVVGSIELMDCNDERHRAKCAERYAGIEIGENPYEIGFLLSPKYWGRGIMTEATVLGVDFAFNTLGASEILIGHLKANTQSGRVQDKVGFEIVNEIPTDQIWIDGKKTTSVRRIMTKEHWKKIRDEKFEKYVK